MALQSATSAAFDEFCATERWCCFPFQPEPIDRTSTAQSIAVSQQTALVGLYHETFKCGLVSENHCSWRSQLKHDGEKKLYSILILIQHQKRIQLLSGLYVLLPSVCVIDLFPFLLEDFSFSLHHSAFSLAHFEQSALTLKQIIIPSLKILSISKLHRCMHKGYGAAKTSPKENSKWMKLAKGEEAREGIAFLLISAPFFSHAIGTPRVTRQLSATKTSPYDMILMN